MKYFGDIPAEHLETLRDLQALEDWFDEHGEDLPLLPVAKGMTCIAHDYYSMEFDEEGERLLRRADKICPGYFKGPIHADIIKDLEFAMLVKLLKYTLGYEVMISLGFDE